MFLGLGTTVLLRNRKKYLRILAISLKATCEGVYVLQPPAYILRGIWRGLLLLTTMIHGLMDLSKWLDFFQGIFNKLPPSYLVVIVTSSMLEYEYLVWETFWMLNILQPLFFWFSLELYNTEQIMMKRCAWHCHYLTRAKNDGQVILSEPTKFNIFGIRFLSVA